MPLMFVLFSVQMSGLPVITNFVTTVQLDFFEVPAMDILLQYTFRFPVIKILYL